MGLFDIFKSKDDKSENQAPPAAGFETVWPREYYFEDYPWIPDTYKASADFLREQINAIGRGEAPQWWQNALPILRQQLKRGVEETFYGEGSERPGAFKTQQQAASITGLGPAQAAVGHNQLLRDYYTKEFEIDELLTKFGVDVTREGAVAYPGLVNNLKQGQRAQLGYPTVVQQEPGGSDTASGIGDILGGVFGGGQGDGNISEGSSITQLIDQFTRGFGQQTDYGDPDTYEPKVDPKIQTGGGYYNGG